MTRYRQGHITSAGTSAAGKPRKKTSQAKLSSLFPRATSKVRKNHPSDCGTHAYERRYISSLQPSELFTTKWQKKKGRPEAHFLYQNSAEAGKPKQLKRARRSRSAVFHAECCTSRRNCSNVTSSPAQRVPPSFASEACGSRRKTSVTSASPTN